MYLIYIGTPLIFSVYYEQEDAVSTNLNPVLAFLVFEAMPLLVQVMSEEGLQSYDRSSLNTSIATSPFLSFASTPACIAAKQTLESHDYP